MKIKKIVCLLAVVLLVGVFAFGLVACGDDGGNDNSGEGKSYTLSVWGAKEDQALLKELCKAYAEANPQNKYTFLYGVQGENDVADKVNNDPTTGPDVFSFASDQINKLYRTGALQALPTSMADNVKANNSAGSVDAATITVNGEDKMYAFPSTGDNCYFLYYDSSILTSEDVKSMDTILAKASAAGKQMHFRLNEDGWYLSSFFFANPDLKYSVTYGDNLSESKVEINYNNADGLKVMRALYSYATNDALSVTTDDSKIVAGFTDGTVCAAVSGVWNASLIKEQLGDNFAVAILPKATIDGEQVQLVSYMGYKLMGVNAYSQNRTEALKLAQWLTNEKSQTRRYEVRGFGPTNNNVANLNAVKNDEILSVVLEQSKYARTQKNVPSMYWTPMSSLITSFVTSTETLGDADFQALLDSLVKNITANNN